MFSERTSYSLQRNALTLALEERRRKGLPILDLTESNPTRAGFHYPQAPILDALASPRSLLYEPTPFGLTSARKAVAAYYQDRGRRIDSRHIILTASTSEAYSFLFKVLADTGDEVLIPRPSYPLFDFLARLSSVNTVHYPLVYDGSWHLDRSALESRIGSRTRAIVFVSPNNPTGSLLEREDWEWLSALCISRRLPLIWDEVFHDYPVETGVRVFDPLSQPEVPAFVLNGLSKTVALPQLKLAWIALTGQAEFREKALERLEIVADTFLSVGTPVQHALPQLLSARAPLQAEIRVRLLGNLATLHELLSDSPAEILPVQAGWYAVIRLPRVRTEDQWVTELLDKHGALIHPGYFYDFEEEAFAVVSLLPAAQVFQDGISGLANLLK